MTDLREQLQGTLGSAYTLERELGGGGMSRVFVAHETSLGRKVVVKVLPSELAAGVNVDRFRREIQLAAQLQHACIVPVHAAGVSEGLPFYTMPLVEGESLRQRLARVGELPIQETIHILKDVAEALSYAHDHGVVHRDIKPDNILLTKHHALVADFGVAKALSASTNPGSSLTSLGVALGTPAYMAPEQAAADPATDHRADIYAFGAVGYEMLTGQQLFAGRSPQAMLAAHATVAPTAVTTLRPTVPAGLAALIMCCLEKHAADRPQNAEQLLVELGALATPSGGMSPTAAVPARKATTKRAFRVAIPLAAVALLAAVGIALLKRQASDATPLAVERVLILPFQNKTGDPRFNQIGSMASDWITRGLTETGLVEVTTLPADAVGDDARVATQGSEALQRMGREAGAGTIITGTVYLQGDSLHFQAHVNDAATGMVQRTVGPVAASSAAPLKGIEALRQRLIGTLAALIDPDFRTSALVTSQPPTFEAYRELMLGEEAFAGRNAYAEALPHYLRAASLDSTFVFPLIRASYVYLNLGDLAHADSLGRALQARSHQLTPFESHLVARIIAWCAGDFGAAYRAGLELRRVAPKSYDARYLAARSAIFVNRPREAIDSLEALGPSIGRLRNFSGWYTDLGWALHLVGEHGRELAVAERALTQHPDRTGWTVLRFRALAGAGRIEELRTRLASVEILSLAEADPILLVVGNELDAHGYAEEARRVRSRHQERLASTRPQESEARAQEASLANVLRYLGRFEEAAPKQRALAEKDTIGADLSAWGVVAAKMGDKAEAERIIAILAGLKRRYDRGFTKYRIATVAAALGDRERAVVLLRQAQAEGVNPQNAGAWHADPDLAPLRGYPPYEELIRPKG